MSMQNKKVEIRERRAVITETREIEFADNEGVEDLRRKLKTELGNIVRSVKSLKERAEEIKATLGEIEKHIEKKAGPTKDPA